MIKSSLLVLILYVTCCYQSAFAAVSLSDAHTLIYKGTITFDENSAAFALYDRSTIKPTTIEITSLGGGINAGLQLGEWIVANKLDVSIPKYCFLIDQFLFQNDYMPIIVIKNNCCGKTAPISIFSKRFTYAVCE